jgi:hypothetical protein
MKLLRSFIKGKMNKSVDERLLPDGEYVDALNVRVGNTETTEIGSLENTKGNIVIAELQYNNAPLSSSAVCLGAYADGANDTIYWFVHDPASSSPSGIYDAIVSYNVQNATFTYIAESVDDGTGTATVLNFNKKYLVNGINLIENLLFFTDNYNPPRMVDVNRSYGFVANASLLNVIKYPPLFAPETNLVNIQSSVNYIEDKFVSFAYRYKYREGQYSALSPFTPVAFEPRQFNINIDNFTNDGMLNDFNAVEVTINSGGSDVIGYDLCFKYADDNFVRVAERLDKDVLDNQDVVITFDNSKTYTILPQSEILRLYDNVPRLAKAQTIMGNRVMYGNYTEGYDLIDKNDNPVNLDYYVEYEGEAVNFNPFGISFDSGSNTILGVQPAQNLSNQIVEFDLTGTSFVAGTQLYFRLNIEHSKFVANPYYVPPVVVPTGIGSGAFTIELTLTLSQFYATVFDFATSNEFLSAIGTSIGAPSGVNVSQPQTCGTATQGGTLSDEFICNIEANQTSSSNTFTIYRAGYAGSNGGQAFQIITSAGSNVIGLRILAANFLDTAVSPAIVAMAEYFQITSAEGNSQSTDTNRSLHSDRNYEVAIEYLDDYGRSSTALVSQNNSVYVPCIGSLFKNTLKVKIPTSQRAPEWAKYYRFLIKPDRYLYQTIYATNWYTEVGTNNVWIQLEGENQQKVEVGDFFRPKADINGAITDCCQVEVLDKQNQQRNFLSGDDTDDPPSTREVAGVYMKVKPQCFDTDKSQTTILTNTFSLNYKKDDDNRLGDYLFANFPVYQNDAGSGLERWKPQTGDIVYISINSYREPQKKCKDTCGAKQVLLDTTITSSADYNDFKSFWEGEGLPAAWANSPDNTIECIDDGLSGVAQYSTDLGVGSTSDLNLNNGYFASDATFNITKAQFYEVTNSTPGEDDYLFLRITGGFPYCSNRKKGLSLDVEIRITQNPNTLVFETIPTDANADLYYEDSNTYRIDSDGNHLGLGASSVSDVPENGDTNQDITSTPTTGTEGIINLDFYNCFTFGNGVESYRILDSLSQQFFLFGSRTNVTTNETFREINRFADITYSGTYSQEQNINRLNEFNLGLANFKSLEQSFGDIQVLDSRQTDMLVLQEDRISYVLVGKNLLSDSAGGGAVTSVPEVLGTQIARPEKYGISFNPESYIQWGTEKFFTDAKRGVVLRLDGVGQSERLSIVSDMGMDSWFRDLFQDDFYTQKLGGYDPYMDEYILHSNETLVPIDEDCIECGLKKTITLTDGFVVRFCVEYGSDVGTTDLDYVLESATGDIDITVTYDGVDTTQTNVTASGTLTFNKNKPNITKADVTITGNADSSVFTFSAECPTLTPLTVVTVCVTSDTEAGQSIHNEYNYTTSNGISFPIYSQGIVFQSGSFPVVSDYTLIAGNEGDPYVPIAGSDVTMYSKVIAPDNFQFDPASDKFRFLRSNTLYNNNATDINSLLAASSIATIDSSGAPQTYKATFNLSATGQYLYLIYDYRNSTPITICYESAVDPENPTDTDINNVCCECEACSDWTPFVGTRQSANTATICAFPTYSETMYHNGTGTTPIVGDQIAVDPSGTPLYPGSYPSTQGWIRLQESPNELIFVETVSGRTNVLLKQLC